MSTKTLPIFRKCLATGEIFRRSQLNYMVGTKGRAKVAKIDARLALLRQMDNMRLGAAITKLVASRAF